MAQKDIDWFEKQREQKPANKVEPKFKVGDWVVSNRYTSKPFCITKIRDTSYLVDNDCFILFERESDWELGTIQDAKDGDVLAYDNGCVEIILLFKKWYHEVGKGAYSYAHITSSGHHIHTNDWSDCGLSAHPATKKQLNILFQKMKEEGYEWDAEKKELRKVEPKLIDKIQPKFKVGDIIKNKKNGDTVKVEQILSDSYCYSGWDGAATIHSDFLISDQDNWELVEQKPADNEMIEILRTEYEKGRADAITEFQKEWSEEDKHNLNSAINLVHNTRDGAWGSCVGERIESWLKSLKDRVRPQQKQEWSKEDYNDIETIACHLDNTDNEGLAEVLRNIRDKYYHIISRNTWKPSDEQINALEQWLKDNQYKGDARCCYPILFSLYQDLKRLKG